MAKIYTGIEFNNTPENIRSLMPRIAAQLKKEGWFLRTNMVGFYSQGGIRRSHFAAGIDMPLFGFYGETPENMGEVFAGMSPLIDEDAIDLLYQDIQEVFPDFLSKFNSSTSDVFYDTVATGVKLLGYLYNEPSDFLICYAPDEKDEEVLPMLYLAKKYHIPVINLAHKANLDRILYWLGA